MAALSHTVVTRQLTAVRSDSVRQAFERPPGNLVPEGKQSP